MISPPIILPTNTIAKNTKASLLYMPDKNRKKLSAILCSKPDRAKVIIDMNMAKYLPT